jgi:hypothetical protein
MRLTGLVLCLLVAPAMAAPVQFTSISGTLEIDTTPDGIASPDPLTVALGGTWIADLSSSGHLEDSDTFVLGAADLTNEEIVAIGLAGLATATMQPGDVAFTGFINEAGPGIVPSSIYTTDAEFAAHIVVTGLLETVFDTATSAGMALPFEINVGPVSAGVSDTITMTIAGTFGYEIGVSDITQTLTLDLVITVVGTAHMVPDPALGGLTALGLGGAGAWLRRRRS